MHKRCVICGIELDETVAVCPKCGTRNSESPAEPVPAVDSASATGPSRCVICGIMLDDAVSVCPKCGTRNPAAAPREPEPGTPIAEPVLPETSEAPAQPEIPTAPETPAPPKAPTRKKRHRRKRNPKFLLLCAVALALIVGIILLVSFLGGISDTPTDPPSAFSSLLDGQLALLSGNPENLERLAPEEYWEYCAYRNSCTKEEHLINMKAHHIIYYELNYPKGDTTYTGEILFEDTMNAQMLQKVTDALFDQYGILANSVTDGKELNIQVKKVTSGDATVLPVQTIYAVEINDAWYLISYTELNGESIVSFFLR